MTRKGNKMSSKMNFRKLLDEQGILDSQVVAYSRKSRDEQNGEGMQNHRDALTTWAKENLGLDNLKIYEEVDSSETLDREQFNQLREDIKKKRIKVLLVLRLDRISRKITDMERVLKEFNFHDLILIETARDKMVNYKEILGLKLESIVSDLFLEQSKQVLYAGRVRAVQLYGYHQGPTCLGYDYNKQSKKLVPNKDAHIVKQIYSLCLSGYSTPQIAIRLNEQGLRSKNGNRFTAPRIWHILVNDKYKGTQSFGKKSWFKDDTGQYHVKDHPEDLWVVYDQAHEPLIDPEDWEKVQELLIAKPGGPRGGRKKTRSDTSFPVSGLIKCANDGYNMTVISRKYKNSVVPMVRHCSRVDYLTGEKCTNKTVSVEKVVNFMKADFWANVRPAIMQMRTQLAKGGKLQRAIEKKVTELTELVKQRKDLEKGIDNLIELQIQAGVNDKLVTKMKQLESQLKLVNDEIQRLEQIEDTDGELQWVEDFLEDAKDIVGFPFSYNGMNNGEQNVFWKRWYKGIKVLDGEVVGHEYTNEVKAILNMLPTEPEIPPVINN